MAVYNKIRILVYLFKFGSYQFHSRLGTTMQQSILMGIFSIHGGIEYVNAGKNSSLCLENTGSFVVVVGSSAIPSNMIVVAVKNKAPV
jgi:hypothetical protein